MAVQALLALTCSHLATPYCAIGAELHPVEPLPQDAQTQVDQHSNTSSDSQAAPGNGLRIIGLTPRTPPWFLERMRRLLHDGRADDAHSLAEEELVLFPDPDELRLGAAFAARRLTATFGSLMKTGWHQRFASARPTFVWRVMVRGDGTCGLMPSSGTGHRY